MSTLNGIGTMYYSWRHHDDDTATATKWFVVMWLPVIPLARHHLRVLTDLAAPEPFVATGTQGFLAGTPAQHTEYHVIETGSPQFREVALTLAWTYLAGPLLLAWPLAPFWLVGPACDYFGISVEARRSNTAIVLWFFMSIPILVNPIVVTLWALRQARGRRPLRAA